MATEIDIDDLPDEQQAEARAAFGEDADLIQLEPEDLEKPPEKHYAMEDLLEEGDWVTIQHRAGNVTTGPVTEVESYGFTVDPRNRTTSGFFSYRDFGGERGVCNELLDLNGDPVDVDYEPEVVDRDD